MRRGQARVAEIAASYEEKLLRAATRRQMNAWRQIAPSPLAAASVLFLCLVTASFGWMLIRRKSAYICPGCGAASEGKP